ncbi:MAG: hypothetical protein A07HB70_01649 [uncultured archaeon A07HB70]|nr:MAG: hypothetical protein A07HB70_01649 [uncultured archaeon A07HB70]
MVAERLERRAGGVEQVERLLAALDEREDARSEVVAGATDERVGPVERPEPPDQPTDAVRVVVDALEVRVVQEPGHPSGEPGGPRI